MISACLSDASTHRKSEFVFYQIFCHAQSFLLCQTFILTVPVKYESRELGKWALSKLCLNTEKNNYFRITINIYGEKKMPPPLHQSGFDLASSSESGGKFQ